MKSLVSVFALATFAMVAGVVPTVTGCSKDPPPKPVDEPKKTTPVPSDMVFNDFVPPGGGDTLAVKMDGGALEAGLAAAGGGESPAGDGGAEGDGAGKLHVIEPGAEPRAVRRYAFAANKPDRRLLTMRQSATHEGGGAPKAPPQEASFVLTADFTAKQIKPSATKMELKVVKLDIPDLPAAQKAQAAAQLGAFTGLTGTFDVSPRGEVGEVEFKADERMQGGGAEVILQSLQQALELVVPPFPDAPVGAGAKWERTVQRNERGMEQKATHTFTLKEVTAEGGVVLAEIDLKMPKHPLAARGAPPGATEEVSGKGAYTYSFKFDHVSSKVDGELAITRKIEATDPRAAGGAGAGKQTILEIIKLKNQLDTPGAAAAPKP